MANQQQSPLFSLPLEIREAIYAYVFPNDIAVHVSLKQGSVAITRCLAPVSRGFLDGSERFPEDVLGDIPRKAIWMRRVQSSWGPHWKCEENAQRPAGNRKDPTGQATEDSEAITAILVVCRKIFTETCRVLSGKVVFHVTELDTLVHLAENASVAHRPVSPYAALSADARSIKNLAITLRLPLSFFLALEEYLGDATSFNAGAQRQHYPVAEGDCSLVGTWMGVWPALAAGLLSLQTLRVSVDHDDKQSWSLVHERALLSQITSCISPAKCPSLKEVAIELPKLHPKYESRLRHFTKGSPQPPAFARLGRQFRPCLFFEETNAQGTIDVVYQADFPTLVEVVEMHLDRGTRAPLEEFEQWEKAERTMFENGEDPLDIIGIQL
ncbi:hypothetical protein GE09DRAFT_4862 [Coniochaeta sp. 2T2.1]|nr:hypothetical protein GE09DRAFT_4862 [Coniochaeta sp. 2T2.1]